MYYIYFTRFRPLILSVLRRIPYSLPGLPNDEVDTFPITSITITVSHFPTIIFIVIIIINLLMSIIYIDLQASIAKKQIIAISESRYNENE